MKELLISDTYQINAMYPLDHIHFRSVQLLYQPLIGNQATTLYLSLYAELDQIELTKAPCLHSRLSKISSLSLKDILQARKKLEGIGLLKTYQKDNHYLYELQLPLLPSEFFHHQILNTLLYQCLQKEDYQRTVIAFTNYKQEKDQFEDITASFLDVYHINLDDTKKPPLLENDYLSRQTRSIEQDYDLSLFYEQLSTYQIPKKAITQEIEHLIQQLGMMYEIPSTKMLELVKDSLDQGRIHTKALIQACRDFYDLKMPTTFKEVFHTQSIKHLSQATKDEKKQAHIEYLEKTMPCDILKHKMGGKEPLRRDLQLIESLLTTLDLEPGVVNVLIELTLAQCDNNLPKNFMEAIGSTWKRKKIKTVADAIAESRKYLEFKKQNEIDWFNEEDNHVDQTPTKKISDEEIEKMLEMIS